MAESLGMIRAPHVSDFEHSVAFLESTKACILELMLCLGIPPDGEPHPGAMGGADGDGNYSYEPGLLHKLASGGCETDQWDDRPRPLPPALQHRLMTACALLGADIEMREQSHAATPLAWACWFGCEPGIRAMLSLGADRGAVDAYGTNPRFNALSRHQLVIDDIESTWPESFFANMPTVDSNRSVYPGEVCRRYLATWSNLRRLRLLHAGWVEEEARTAAAIGAQFAALACLAVSDGRLSLPGPALQAVGDALMRYHFRLWAPMTRPVVTEFMLAATSDLRHTSDSPSSAAATAVACRHDAQTDAITL